MSVAFVLGNGISRQGVDLEILKNRGTVYGCNAIYRDFSPHVLISTDIPISAEIQHSGYSQQHKHYTRKPLSDLGAVRIPQKYFGFSSGPVATAIASLDGHNHVYLVGFDLGPTRNGLFNNVYAGTEFYKKPSATPTYTGNWERQLLTIMGDFPRIQYIRIVGDTTAAIEKFKTAENYSTMDTAEFLNRINNTKDL